MQLKVKKADGSKELYLHTKVLGALAAGLADAGHLEAGVAEQLAEAVTDVSSASARERGRGGERRGVRND